MPRTGDRLHGTEPGSPGHDTDDDHSPADHHDHAPNHDQTQGAPDDDGTQWRRRHSTRREVDGSNLPMYVNITKGGTADKISSTGCVAAGCTKAVRCPAALVVDGGAGCESPCAKLGGDQYCCQGKYSSRDACDSAQWQPEDYAKIVWKDAEPYAYSYVDDDATSTFTCTGECDYRITFGTTP
jgi:hypothetical protein